MNKLPPLSVEPTYEEIARLAYHFFEESGRQHGHDVEDWLQAQAHLCTDSSHVAVSPQELKKHSWNRKDTHYEN